MPVLRAVTELASGGPGVARLFVVIAAVFVAAKVFGEVAIRLRQPAVLGEIIAGVLLGRSLLGLVDPADPVIAAMAQIGVVVLLFTTGLHADLKSLVAVGGVATTVAVAGVVLPFVAGYGAAVLLGVGPLPALVCGAALCATSVGISARVLGDLGRLDSTEGRVVLGAAVIDDVIGLIILSIVAAAVVGGTMAPAAMGRVAGAAIGFIVLAVVLGGPLATVGYKLVRRLQSTGALGLLALAFAFVLAAVAEWVGSAMIIGAFAAGLVLDDRHDREEIARATASVGDFFVPIFFASVGAAVDLRALATGRSLGIGAALVGCGIVGKIAAGYAPFWFRGNKLLVGIAMVPRGEVGLVFAQMGLASGALDGGLFGAVMLMVLVTTLVTPPALSALVKRTAPVG